MNANRLKVGDVFEGTYGGKYRAAVVRSIDDEHVFCYSYTDDGVRNFRKSNLVVDNIEYNEKNKLTVEKLYDRVKELTDGTVDTDIRNVADMLGVDYIESELTGECYISDETKSTPVSVTFTSDSKNKVEYADGSIRYNLPPEEIRDIVEVLCA